MYLDLTKCSSSNPSLLSVTLEAKKEDDKEGEEGSGEQGGKGSSGIYGDKMLGSGRVCGIGIDQWSMQRTHGPNPDP